MLSELRNAGIGTWTKRTGKSAALHLWSSLKWLCIFLLISPFWIAAFVLASTKQLPALHVLGFILVAAQWMCFTAAVHHLRRFHRAASHALGVHVGWNDPPSRESKFKEWCEKKGIQPYAIQDFDQ